MEPSSISRDRLSLEEAEGLQVFAALYIALALVLTFWTLPVLVTTLTPFSYREVVWSTRDALVTSFATGNMFVVLAMLAERSKALLRNLVTALLEVNEQPCVEVAGAAPMQPWWRSWLRLQCARRPTRPPCQRYRGWRGRPRSGSGVRC